MLSKEQFTDILLTLANKDAYGAASLGYLPHMLYAKWLLDNKEPANDTFIGMFGTYVDNFSFPTPTPNHLDISFSNDELHPFGPDDDTEGLFRNLSNEFAVHEYQKLCGKFEEVKDHITKVLMSLDLSEASIPHKDIAEAFDVYLAEMMEAGGASFNLTAGIPEKLIGRIVKEFWFKEPDKWMTGSLAYDPFCKFGTLIAEVPGDGFPRKKEVDYSDGLPRGDIRSESYIYPDIAHIRLAFHDVVGDMKHDSPISTPQVVPTGGIRKYRWVVSDISGIDSSVPSSAFQLDIHKRYQTYCPDAEYLNQDTAMLTAHGSVIPGGHMALITSRGGGRTPPLFSTMESGSVKSFLIQDTLEAVIDLPVHTSEEPKGMPHRRVRTAARGGFKRIYIFMVDKSAERQGKILFINGASAGDDDEIIGSIAHCYHDFAAIPGFSAVVSLDTIISQVRPVLNPDKYTKIIEEPEPEEEMTLIHDLQILEERRKTLNRDIISYVEKLTGIH